MSVEIKAFQAEPGRERQVLILHSSSLKKRSCNIISLVLAASQSALLNRAIQIASHAEPKNSSQWGKVRTEGVI